DELLDTLVGQSDAEAGSDLIESGEQLSHAGKLLVGGTVEEVVLEARVISLLLRGARVRG
ncbi:MAG TPA: hypothetical protein PLL04_03910, partial [Thauera sp.]|nr:hypothetical protein [Thauera sp.]